MKLNDIASRRLLPQMQNGEPEDRLNWMCQAFDVFVKSTDERKIALSAPVSLAAIEALTDEELQQLYTEFGLATYYPDLPRHSRNQMLFDQIKYYRKLGTTDAVYALLRYIFGDNPISLTIVDNLAFDQDGILTDESLLNLYDVYVNVENPTLGAFELSRIFANLNKFGRNSQKLRGIQLQYANDNEATCELTAVTDGDIAEIFVENDEVCPYTPMPVGDIHVGYLSREGQGTMFTGTQWMRNSDGSWQEIPGYNDLYVQLGNACTTFLSMKDTNGNELGVSTLYVSTVDGTGNLQVGTSQAFNDVETITYQINWQ